MCTCRSEELQELSAEPGARPCHVFGGRPWDLSIDHTCAMCTSGPVGRINALGTCRSHGEHIYPIKPGPYRSSVPSHFSRGRTNGRDDRWSTSCPLGPAARLERATPGGGPRENAGRAQWTRARPPGADSRARATRVTLRARFASGRPSPGGKRESPPKPADAEVTDDACTPSP